MQPTSPYHFEKLRSGHTIATTSSSSSMPSSPFFGNRPPMNDQHYERERLSAMSPRMLNNVDRRHRSPDPPPRLVTEFVLFIVFSPKNFDFDFNVNFQQFL